MKKSIKTLHWLEGSECTGWAQCPYCIKQEKEFLFQERYDGIIHWCQEDRSEELSSQYEQMYLDEYAFDWQISQGLKDWRF